MSSDNQFVKVLNEKDIALVSSMAFQIWHEHYANIVSKQQINYMLERFQSLSAIKNQIKKEEFLYYLIFHNVTPVAYFAIQKQDAKMFLSKIYVTQKFRGRGYGRIIINYIEEQCSNLFCQKIYLTVNKHNKNTIKIYNKLGFQIITSQKKDIGNHFYMDDYVMEKTLKDKL